MARLNERRDQKHLQSVTSAVEHRSTTDNTLANYLDAMLHDVTTRLESVEEIPQTRPERRRAPVEVPSTPDATPVAKVTAKEASDSPQPDTSLLVPESVPESQEVILPETRMVERVVSAHVVDVSDESRHFWLENGRPAWAQERFDCLMFVVDGLRLAVPLLLLGNIHPLDKPLTPLFDQPKWFLGLLSLGQERTIRVVDTAKLVMPERYRVESSMDIEYAVGVHDSDWAFGCHQIEGSISLVPEQVKWRSSRTSRPWLAGTVIDEMCALVDLHAFSKTLVTDQGR